ncbi:hypothetical protein G6F57_020203 [Rhizopus arrhizus]|nr:hypothetical protein G6F57_020203 [Rhizopus arrhizus]
MTQQRTDHGVLQHGHLPEAARDLIRAHQAQRGHLFRPQSDHGPSVEADRTGGGFVVADQAVEQRALAGAVGADDGDDFARRHRQRNILVRNQAAKALGQVINVQQSHGASSMSPDHPAGTS